MKNIEFLKQAVSDKENSNKYILKNDIQELGYAYIYHGDFKNNIYIFINPKYRSNGYGFLLFSNVINELKNTTKYSHIILDTDKSNTHINNIIAKCGGLLLAEDSQSHWILKI